MIPHSGYCKKEFLPNNRGFDSFFGQWSHVVNYYTRITPAKHWKEKKKYHKKHKSMMDYDISEKVNNENEMKKGYDLHYNDDLTNKYEGKVDIFELIFMFHYFHRFILH